MTQGKTAAQQFRFDNITAGLGWMYHIFTKQTCPRVIHACCSCLSSWEQHIWVKWNLLFCVMTTLPAGTSFKCVTVRIPVERCQSLRFNFPVSLNGCRGRDGAVRYVYVIISMLGDVPQKLSILISSFVKSFIRNWKLQIQVILHYTQIPASRLPPKKLDEHDLRRGK